MFTVVAMVLQKIMTAQWGQVKRRQNSGHHRNCISNYKEK
jgi:hypothetical protein